MTTDLPMPTVRPSVGAVQEHAPKPMRLVLNWGRRYSLWVFNFGLACCAIEFIAGSMSRHDFIRLGVIPFAPGPRQADLMVVSGTVTDKMAPAVRRLYDQMPEPKYVISFGACSNSGGPYWDSYSVTKGVDQLVPVDVYVPGCPPRPEALLQGIVTLQNQIAEEKVSSEGILARLNPFAGRGRTAASVQRPLVTKPAAPEAETVAEPAKEGAATESKATPEPAPADAKPAGKANLSDDERAARVAEARRKARERKAEKDTSPAAGEGASDNGGKPAAKTDLSDDERAARIAEARRKARERKAEQDKAAQSGGTEETVADVAKPASKADAPDDERAARIAEARRRARERKAEQEKAAQTGDPEKAPDKAPTTKADTSDERAARIAEARRKARERRAAEQAKTDETKTGPTKTEQAKTDEDGEG
jgi:NADH-quinone oxidoreductase subunit B